MDGTAEMTLYQDIRRARSAILLAGLIAFSALPFREAVADGFQNPPADMVAPIGWYYYGGLETGGRFVFDRPPSGFARTFASSNGDCVVGGASVVTTCFATASQTQSLAKFEEYGNI